MGAALLAVALPAFAQQYIQDSGRITKLYVHGDEIAIAVDGGFPNAVASNVCPSAQGYFAGNKAPSRNMVAALLTAKATGAKVSFTYGGCEATWYKITDVYILD